MVVRKFYLFSFVRLVGPILPTALRSIFLTERFFLFNIILTDHNEHAVDPTTCLDANGFRPFADI